MVLEADPQVAAALERQAREPRGDHVPAQHRDRPGEVASLEHGEVGLQAGRAGREAEGHAGPAEIALVSAEVELHEGAGWQPSRAPSSAKSALWLWTMAAPAARQRTASAAISAGERGTEGFRSGVVTPLIAASMMTGVDMAPL